MTSPPTPSDTPDPTALHDLSAHHLLQHYRRRSLSPVEVTRSVLAHMASCEPHLHACYAAELPRLMESALTAARASEARWQAGEPLHCGGTTLDGVPVTLKENIATAGCPLPLGTAATPLQPALQDAPPAARLQAAGAILVAKTTMPDYGMLSCGLSSIHATARNPWDTQRTPGGSSAGAGAAAAAGYGPLHVGTDIGGSIRLPAGWCGLFGFKPSLGRIPIDPPYMARVAGPLTRTVADAALMMAVLSQPDPRDATSLPYQHIAWHDLDCRGLKGLRLGLWLDAGCGLPLEPAVRRAVEVAARIMAAAGAVVEPLPAWTTPAMLNGVDRFWRARSAADLNALSPERRDRVLPFIQAWAEGGAHLSGAEVFAAYSQTFALRTATVAATLPFDYVLSPVAAMPAFPAEWPCPTRQTDTALHHIAYTVPFSMSEQPAASVNCGYSPEGWPIGLQIAGRRFDDLGVLQLARAWEQLRPAQRPWPSHPNLR